MQNGTGLLIQNVSLSIRRELILADAHLAVPTGGTVALLGTSGSGKTSLLRIIAGLQSSDSGRIYIEGRDVTDMPPEERSVSMLFQQPALFPEKTIEQNALAAARARREPRAAVSALTAEVLEMMDQFQLLLHQQKAAHVLSGGQYQRAAIVRCLANSKRSKVLLLDEPFQSNLNLSLRWALMEWLKGWLAARHITCLLVTHDFSEAAFFASQIAVIDEDKHSIVTGDSFNLYHHAPNLTVARTIGAANIWELRKNRNALPLSGIQPLSREGHAAAWCICRPSSVVVEPDGSGFEIISQTFLGSVVRVTLRSLATPEFKIVADVAVIDALRLGKRCGAHIDRNYVSYYNDQQDLIPMAFSNSAKMPNR